jgi:hypothetical protein
MQKPIEQVERNLFFPDRSADHEVIESHHQVAGPWEYSPEDPSYLREVLDDIKRRLDNLEFERRQIAISNSNLNTKDVTFYNWLKTEYKNRSVRSAFFRMTTCSGSPGGTFCLICAPLKSTESGFRSQAHVLPPGLRAPLRLDGFKYFRRMGI